MKTKTKKSSTQVVEIKPVEAEPTPEEPVKLAADQEATSEDAQASTSKKSNKKSKKNTTKKQKSAENENENEEPKQEEQKEIPEGELIHIVEPIERIRRRPRKVKEPKLSKQELMCKNFEHEEREAQKQRLAALGAKNETFLTKKKILIAVFFTFLFLVRLFKVFF